MFYALRCNKRRNGCTQYLAFYLQPYLNAYSTAWKPRMIGVLLLLNGETLPPGGTRHTHMFVV